MKIDKTAIVSKKAKIEKNVTIGPYTVIEDNVSIGEGTEISANVYIYKGTTIGKACKLHTGACLGDEPQDMAYKGEETFLKIGDLNTFREHVTVHRGTDKGSSTIIGNDNYFMCLSHVAHNCKIGNNVIICNNTLLAGHVQVEDKAFISASCLIHQFVRVGMLSMMGGGVRINRDLPPYMLTTADNLVSSFNVVGLKRSGMGIDARKQIKEAHRLIYRSGKNLQNALSELKKLEQTPELKALVDFITSSKRGICFSRSNRVLEKEAQA